MTYVVLFFLVLIVGLIALPIIISAFLVLLKAALIISAVILLFMIIGFICR